MSLIVRMIASWLLATIGFTVFAIIFLRQGVHSVQDAALPLIGVCIAIGLPMLLFAMLIALPISIILVELENRWLTLAAAILFFSGAGATLAAWIFPHDAKGPVQSIVVYAGILGLAWGLLGFPARPNREV